MPRQRADDVLRTVTSSVTLTAPADGCRGDQSGNCCNLAQSCPSTALACPTDARTKSTSVTVPADRGTALSIPDVPARGPRLRRRARRGLVAHSPRTRRIKPPRLVVAKRSRQCSSSTRSTAVSSPLRPGSRTSHGKRQGCGRNAKSFDPSSSERAPCSRALGGSWLSSSGRCTSRAGLTHWPS